MATGVVVRSMRSYSRARKEERREKREGRAGGEKEGRKKTERRMGGGTEERADSKWPWRKSLETRCVTFLVSDDWAAKGGLVHSLAYLECL